MDLENGLKKLCNEYQWALVEDDEEGVFMKALRRAAILGMKEAAEAVKDSWNLGDAIIKVREQIAALEKGE